MRAYELMKLFESLSEEERHYVFQHYCGGLDCVASGFNPKHKDAAAAQYAIDQLWESLKRRPQAHAPSAARRAGYLPD